MASFTIPSTRDIETKDAVAQALNNAKDYAGQLTIDILPLSKVEIDPENKRELDLTLEDAVNGISKDDPLYEKKKEDWKSLETLANSLKNGQLINPIFVYRYGTKCRLIAGERRTLASAIAGKSEVIARIAPDRPVGSKLRILQWVENQERQDLSLRERVASIESILDEYFKERRSKEKLKITGQLISDLTGMSIPHSRRYQIILFADETVRKAVDEGRLENLKVIEFICNDKFQSVRVGLLEAALAGKTIKELQALSVDLLNIKKTKVESRGRKRASVSLGTTKPNAAQLIIESLMLNKKINKNIRDNLKEIYAKINWNDYSLVTKLFKDVITVVEKGALVESE